MNILFVANVDWYVISHRIKIIETAVKNGYNVTVACEDTGLKSEILKTGANFIHFKFSRSGTNPIKEIFILYKFYNLYKTQEFDVLHHVSLKPVIYGSFMAKILKKPAVLNAVSGLGYVFTSESSKRGFVQKIMLTFMKFGFKKQNLAFIFQNEDDHKELKAMGSVFPENIVYYIKGSGVNLKEYSPKTDSNSEKIKILFPARMLFDKGIRELKTATELLKKKYDTKIQFILAGKADPGNKAGVSIDYLNEWQDDDYVKWIGFSKDMIQTFRKCDIVVLPSYREGMPKSLIEAAAMGKPIITTNAVGCKECVDHGVNGLLVPVKSGEKIAQALIQLIDNHELREKMGKASRIKAEKEFDISLVINKHLEIYQELHSLSLNKFEIESAK